MFQNLEAHDTELLGNLRNALTEGDAAKAKNLLLDNLSALIGALTPDELRRLLEVLGEDTFALFLSRLSDQEAADMLVRMPVSEAAAVLGRIDVDDATDIFAWINRASGNFAETLMAEMTPDRAKVIQQLLIYPPDTAGGVMTPAFVAIFPELRAEEAISAIQQIAAESETMSYIYVIDREEKLLGVLSLHSLVLNPPETPVRELMAEQTWSVQVDEDQEVVARKLMEHDLAALPVVDDEHHLLGIITHDDVADIIEEEATEDIERLGGSQPLETPYRRAGILQLVRKRIPWLLILFVAEAYTGSILRAFEDELDQVIALAFFIPLLLGTGGNVGSQITTTLVRAMAVENLALRDLRWIVNREIVVGFLISLVIATIAFVRALVLHVGMDVGLVVAITVALICVWASLVSAVLPFLLRRFRFDPTVISAPFITTLVDGTGLLIYFMVAKFVLGL